MDDIYDDKKQNHKEETHFINHENPKLQKDESIKFER